MRSAPTGTHLKFPGLASVARNNLLSLVASTEVSRLLLQCGFKDHRPWVVVGQQLGSC
jgi:hypothetical protein